MARFSINFSKSFNRQAKKLSTDDLDRVQNKIALLEDNLSHPLLHTKKLQGERDLFESRVSDDIRIIWHYGDDNTIIVKDVGHHDILKKY